MDILVFGAGAVGGYLGALLANNGHSVTLIARGSTIKAITKSGLNVVEDDQKITVYPLLVESLRQAFIEKPNYDLVLVTMKAYDAQKALDELVAFRPNPPTLLTLQNGIGIEEMFVKEFGPEKVIAGSLTTPLSQETFHSIVIERVDRGLALAPTEPESDISQWIDLFQSAGVETIGLRDYQSMKWSKALVNMIGNASAAILNRHPRVVYNYGPTFKLEMDMLKETLAVMKVKKLKSVDLPGLSIGRLAFAVKRMPKGLLKPIMGNIVASGRGNKMPSFHIDLMAGREKNEVTYHNRAVAEIGRELGVSVPVNTALADILKKLASKEIDYQEYNGRPQRLVAEVDKYRKEAAR